MALLALSPLGSLIALPSLLLCAVFIVYLLTALPPHADRLAKAAISRVFILASLTFAAVWFWMNLALPLVAWLTVLGDRNHWFYDHSPKIAALIALLISSVAFLRATLGTVSPIYIRALTWMPPILLVTAAAFALEHTLSPVEGLTAQSAAERILRDNVPRTHGGMRLVGHRGPPFHADTPPDNRTFWIVDGSEKVGMIVVRPNRLIGWQLSRSHRFSDSTDVLIDAQVHLNLGQTEKARYSLEQVVQHFPGTPAAQEARRLLATIHDENRGPVQQAPASGIDRLGF